MELETYWMLGVTTVMGLFGLVAAVGYVIACRRERLR